MKDYLRGFISVFAFILGIILAFLILIVPIYLIAVSDISFWWAFSIGSLWAIIWISAFSAIFQVTDDEDDFGY